MPPEGTTEFCQLRTPEAQDIGFKRLLLIFLGVIMAIPFTEIFDATFVKYVCAPLKSCGYVHVLTGVAKRDAIAAFARFDTDGSGAIDSYELVCAMEAMGLPKPSNKDVSRMMGGAEELDRGQFLAMMAQHPKMMARAAALGLAQIPGDGANILQPVDDCVGLPSMTVTISQISRTSSRPRDAGVGLGRVPRVRRVEVAERRRVARDGLALAHGPSPVSQDRQLAARVRGLLLQEFGVEHALDLERRVRQSEEELRQVAAQGGAVREVGQRVGRRIRLRRSLVAVRRR